ncbi:hypothetical protein BH23GEM10_BH23GEM10_06420 [soil metagenome]
MKYARIIPFAVIAAVSTLATACGNQTQAVGNVGSVIVLTTDELWSAIGDSVLAALEPPIFTVRDERTFEVTHMAPSNPRWTEMRNFRQVLVMGAADDAWVRPALGGDAAAGSIVQARNVWARNQFVTAVVLPESSAADAALEAVPAVAAAIDSSFRAYAQQRMYMSGIDSVLADSLRAAAGYSLQLPNVYEQIARESGVALFQNSTSIGGELVRSVLVASRDGVLQLDEAAVLEWRDSVAASEYRPPQETRRETVLSAPVGAGGVEVQGVWRGTDTSWPTAGPFIARAVPCAGQNRTYLIDVWLFAPSRPKYEYMIQLQTILGTFDCA